MAPIPMKYASPGAGAASLARLCAAGLLGRVLRSSLPRFLSVGLLGLATDATVFSIASGSGASDAVARALSLAAATLVTWQLNRRFTFRPSGRELHAEAARYTLVALCAQGFNYGLFLTIRGLAPQVWPLAALGISAVSAAGFSFAGQSLVTFRSRTHAAAAPAFRSAS